MRVPSVDIFRETQDSKAYELLQEIDQMLYELQRRCWKT